VAIDWSSTIKENAHFNPYDGIRSALTPSYEELVAAHKLLDTMTTGGLVEPEKITATADAYREIVERAIDKNARNWTVLIDVEDIMIKIRLNGDLARRTLNLGIIVGAVLLTIILTILFMRSITIPLAKARDVADKLSRGELPERVEVGNATDETGRSCAPSTTCSSSWIYARPSARCSPRRWR